MSKLLIYLQVLYIGVLLEAKPPIHGQNELDILEACYHNGREGISYDDIIEHIGNGEYGSAWRDAKEKEEIQDFLSLTA